NSIERTVQQELKRRTRLVRVFPNREALLRLVSAILVEIDAYMLVRHYSKCTIQREIRTKGTDLFHRKNRVCNIRHRLSYK
ncbi:MAG: transposase-like protein, partial [Neolewinella sp.]